MAAKSEGQLSSAQTEISPGSSFLTLPTCLANGTAWLSDGIILLRQGGMWMGGYVE
jgi:hypothetical protein